MSFKKEEKVYIGSKPFYVVSVTSATVSIADSMVDKPIDLFVDIAAIVLSYNPYDKVGFVDKNNEINTIGIFTDNDPLDRNYSNLVVSSLHGLHPCSDLPYIAKHSSYKYFIPFDDRFLSDLDLIES